ncbi:MAG: PilN domain-containing protein [Bdellovibrionia bacterium]
MIKINLATKKRALNAATGRILPNFKMDSSSLSGLVSELKELPLKKMALAGVITIGATILVDGYKEDQIKAQQAEYDKIISQKPRLEAESSRMKGLQELQESMASDERRIRTKLDTIKRLIGGRSAAASVLEELAKITPTNVWLSEFSMKGSDLAFKGLSQDFGNISDFTRNIQSSAMFSNMTLKDTQMAFDEQKRQIANFSVTAKKR